MYVILESAGDGTLMGIMMKDDDSGDYAYFDTRYDAEEYARKNCAFDYKVVEI